MSLTNRRQSFDDSLKETHFLIEFTSCSPKRIFLHLAPISPFRIYFVLRQTINPIFITKCRKNTLIMTMLFETIQFRINRWRIINKMRISMHYLIPTVYKSFRLRILRYRLQYLRTTAFLRIRYRNILASL